MTEHVFIITTSASSFILHLVNPISLSCRPRADVSAKLSLQPRVWNAIFLFSNRVVSVIIVQSYDFLFFYTRIMA